VACTVLPAAHAQPVIYVDADAAGANDGGSWTDAFTDLQDALQGATAGQEIWVAEGIYKPVMPADPSNVTNPERNATFALKDGVAIYGGFAGTEASREARDVQVHATILSGDLLGDDNDVIHPDEPTRGENSWHIVTAGNINLGVIDSTAVLDGFTITGGNANPPPPNTNNSGGGLYVFGNETDVSNPTLRNLVFTANTARFGGGVGCVFATPILNNVAFIDNAAFGDGVPGDGGGMNNSICASTLRNVLFRENRSDGFGGGLMNNRGTTSLIGGTFVGNMGLRGGGMYNLLDVSVIVNAVFLSNTAVVSGGGMYNDESNIALMNAVFSGNRTLDATQRGGGGMGNFREAPFLANVVFYGNTSARDGGAIFNINSEPRIVNSILWGNEAVGEEDEIFSGGIPGGSPLVVASIVEGGVPESAADGGGNLDADPFFVDADGPDDVTGTEDDDFHLLGASPAIDGGLNQGLLFDVFDLDVDGDTQERVPIDLAGNLRVHDGGTGVLVVDMGVYEFGAPGVLVAAEEEPADLPASPVFLAAYPNPFREKATLRYALPSAGRVVLKVYDMLGREVATLIDGILPAGTHEVRFEAPDLASGPYIYHLNAAGRTATRTMMRVR